MANNTGKKFGGREAGTPNILTNEIREKFTFLVQSNIDKLQNDLDLLEPKERLKIIIELSKFVLPTLKATELSTGIENGFNPITIKIMEADEINLIASELEKKY